MLKETKEIITKETCAKELIKEYKHLRTRCLIIAILSFIGILPIAVIVISTFVDSFSENVFMIILCIILILLIISPFALLICYVFSASASIKRIEKGEFSVVKDQVCDMVDGKKVGRNTVRAVYFSRYGRSIVNGSVFGYTSYGDEFYLVVMNTKKPRPLLIYHTKIYEYKE